MSTKYIYNPRAGQARGYLKVLTPVALALVVVFGLLLSAQAAPARSEPQAAPLADPTSVTLVGNLQDALGVGCSDWSPSCAASNLTDFGNGVWRGEFTVGTPAATTWEYKVALNGTWDESYAGNHQTGGNTTLYLVTTTTVRFYYDHKTHAVLDNVMDQIPVAAGNFQDELGGSEWSPSNVRTLLTDVDGDGVYTFQATNIPPGSYEFKIAMNESWSENYGAGGTPGGDNIPFSISKLSDELFISWDSTTKVPSVAIETGSEPVDFDLVQSSLQNPVQDQVFYFVLPDRFENGSTANDNGGYTPDDRLVHGFDPTDKGFYHGGDLQGLINRLDYIQGLGVTAIWMAPIFQNKPVQGTGSDVSAGYHGYWIVDYTQVDPHFGTNEQLRTLVEQAHARGMKVFFDVITNHTADVIDYKEGKYVYRDKTYYPYKDVAGNLFDDRDYIGATTFPSMSVDTFPYTPIFRTPADALAKTPAWLNNPLVYHNRGNSTYVGENSTYGDFSGLDDLFTERPDVVQGMIDIHKAWIRDFKIDGFRIDTVKHVNIEFWQKFAPEIEAYAHAQGIPDFFMFGEVYSSDEKVLSEYSTKAKLPAVLDFKFQSQILGFASQGSATDGLRDFFANDDYFTDADSNVYALPTFVGNHDMGRLGYFLQRDHPGAPDAELVARSKLAHAAMYFMRGAPVIYYGDEQGFTGDGGDKDARQDMFPSQVASYNDDVLIGTVMTTGVSNFDTTHPLYQAFKTYADLYQAHPALRRGAQIHRYSEGRAGIYAFSRIDRQERIEYVVAFNNYTATRAANFVTYQPNVTFTAIYTANDAAVPASLQTTADKHISVTVPALSFVIYRAETAVPASPAPPRISMLSPTANAQVAGRVQIAAALDRDALAEVTFAVKEASAPTTTYAVIGVDNNAPYQVFYDVNANWPVGTVLTFKAIVTDSGNLKSATVNAVVAAKEEEAAAGKLEYTIVHYRRPAGDYDGWGLHLWGDAIDPSEGTDWGAPKPFAGETDYGRFAFIKLQNDSRALNFIVHKGDDKDPDMDRSYVPSGMPEVWLKQGDATLYPTQAAAQGYVTVHYSRTLGDYDGWGLHLWGDAIDPSEATDWANPKLPGAMDSFGAVFTITLKDPTQPVNFIVHKGDDKDTSADRSFTPAKMPTVWLKQGDATNYATRGAAEGYAVLHYHRTAGDYGDPSSSNYNDFWGLHTWGGTGDPGWTTPRKPTGQDAFGIYFNVPINAGATSFSYILHRGDTKDPGPDQMFDLSKYGYEAWQIQARGEFIKPILIGAGGGNLAKYQAHWLTRDLIAWKVDPTLKPRTVTLPTLQGTKVITFYPYLLYYAPNGGLNLKPTTIEGGAYIPLEYNGALSNLMVAKYPHLEGYSAFKVPAMYAGMVPGILKGQMAVAAFNAKGVVVDATGLQIPGVLDDLYTYDGKLGVIYAGDTPTVGDEPSLAYAGETPTLKLWAPTARRVTLHLFSNSISTTQAATYPMAYDAASGVWSITGPGSWNGRFYLYEVEVYVHATGKVEHNLVTDPYAVSLSTNSQRSQIVNLEAASLKPAGWDTYTKPALDAPEDIVIYELHVRDFSVNDTSVPTDTRGTFKAFTYSNSNGMQHLRNLAQAGLTHLHLLPVFDFATIEEDKTKWVEPSWDLLASYPPTSTQQQAAIDAVRDQDGFNWGYDPYHYSVPEGSYSTNPDGATRILEFREMVQSLNNTGLRVVMDVVYNHTNSCGQAPRSVLDKIVPGYYHRLDENGAVTTSTCCPNTATEHNMMEKLMVDSVVLWAKYYKVDGFRFDLMGHHMKSNMLKVRAALDALTPANDGVDGSKIYIYGEGWNFGEVQNNARGVNATQLNLAGTGIGTFSDRLRDAVRGGGPFDNGNTIIYNQGFVSGVYYDPNPEALAQFTEQQRLNRMHLYADQIMVGLAGNLANYTFTSSSGLVVSGSQVDYNGSPAGYNADPQEHVVYAEAHDNQTLFDLIQYKMPLSATMDSRVRAQNVGLSIVSLAQGVPFFHAGIDMLRSKSMDRNSYNSGDWFNKLDFTYQDNNWAVGLPMAGPNAGDWAFMEPRLADPNLKPGYTEIVSSVHHLQEMLRIRKSSPLFRLQTAEEIQKRVHFYNTGPNQLPGLVVMELSDPTNELDAQFKRIVVLFNANDEPQTFTGTAFISATLTLHPVQAGGYDPVVKSATFDPATGAFIIPARTTAVFCDRVVHEIHIFLPVVLRQF